MVRMCHRQGDHLARGAWWPERRRVLRAVGDDDLDIVPGCEIVLHVIDSGSGTIFGPFSVGDKIKYTEAPGGVPTSKPMGSSSGEAARSWPTSKEMGTRCYRRQTPRGTPPLCPVACRHLQSSDNIRTPCRDAAGSQGRHWPVPSRQVPPTPHGHRWRIHQTRIALFIAMCRA